MVKSLQNLYKVIGVGEKKMAIIYCKNFHVSKTSLELQISEGETELSNKLKVLLNCGEHSLQFDFLILKLDVKMIYTMILDNWDELLEIGLWDSVEPSFSFSLFEIIYEDKKIYQFQFWIDAGEFYAYRTTRSGIGITIYQDRETIEQFALQIKSEEI